MALVAFTPENDLENLIADAKSGERSTADMVSLLLKSGVFIAAKRELEPDGSGFDPVLLGQGDAPLVAVFSSGPRATLHRDVAACVLRMAAVDLFKRIPAAYGVILNPGYEVQMVMPAAAIAEMRAKILAGLGKHASKTGA